MSDAVTAVGTVALVVVTALYVILTNRLARSAEASARYALAAAEAAARANTLQLATMPVEFSIRISPLLRSAADYRNTVSALTLTSTGANVWLHSVELIGFATLNTRTTLITVDPVRVQGLDGDRPVFLQLGESWTGQVRPAEGGFSTPAAEPIGALHVSVAYSLEETSEVVRKRFAVAEDGTRVET